MRHNICAIYLQSLEHHPYLHHFQYQGFKMFLMSTVNWWMRGMIKESQDFLMNLNGILKPSKIKEQKVLHIRLNLHKLLNLIIDVFCKYTTRSTDIWNSNKATY